MAMKCVFKHRILQMFELKLNKCHQFYPLDDVGRYREQLLNVT